jgi:hypothetical protein
MKKGLFVLINILGYVWQLPQHLLAVVLLLIYRRHIVETRLHNTSIVFICDKFMSAGISLGNFIFLTERSVFYDKNVIAHEYGHSLQSYMFGLLYLLIIGIPSLINNLRSRTNADIRKRYYKLYPERWADQLGGVVR